jgi:glycosyltransferase involved in cell wall biosynthesis
MGELRVTTDVCLILEGTYPYVRGGVSSWVHNLIRGLPEVTFSLLAISPSRGAAGERKYELPRNVRAFVEVFIHELASERRWRRPKPSAAAWQAFRDLHRARGPERAAAARALLASSAGGVRGGLTADDALFSREAWDFVLERYRADAPETSFIDYFWTWRAVHAPLFQTMAAEIPPARVYHPVSTGYAGLLGAIARLRTGSPLLLTEHGIYVRERLIDIARADWIYEEPVRLRAAQNAPNPLRALWSDLFTTLAQVTYDLSDQVIALFESNQALQHELGADPAKTRVIPNGVNVEQFAPLAAQRRENRPLRAGFVGRVVPIKDVKTLLRAFKLAADQVPSVEFWIVGPTDEDKTYYDECQELVRTLGLTSVRFTGPQDVKTIYPEIDVMVLTSISEGQPLTILEAACAGVPSVATDVGDCRALLEGRSRADQALGPSGIVTRMGDPDDTARAIARILTEPETRARMSRAGIERTRRFYRESQVLERYRELYAALAGRSPLPAGGGQAHLELVPGAGTAA